MKYGPLGRLFRQNRIESNLQTPIVPSRRVTKIKPAEDILDFKYPEASAFYQGECDEPTS